MTVVTDSWGLVRPRLASRSAALRPNGLRYVLGLCCLSQCVCKYTFLLASKKYMIKKRKELTVLRIYDCVLSNHLTKDRAQKATATASHGGRAYPLSSGAGGVNVVVKDDNPVVIPPDFPLPRRHSQADTLPLSFFHEYLKQASGR